MAGIYLHIPFCKQQCTYCDFHFSTTFEAYREQMINTITTELVSRVAYLEQKPIETIYFGGGTPSLLNKEEISKLLDSIQSNYQVVSNAEISLEANPDDISVESLREWKELGINRLSIGLQSFKEADLKWMNRAHTVNEAQNCVRLAQSEGFENLTVDLIYGLPNLTMDEWRNHVQTVIDFGVPHISAYCLTVEEKTVLHKLVKNGKIDAVSDETQGEQFMVLLEMLEANEYAQYEISNFSKLGFESMHNGNYWKGEWYLGVGPSAHSFNGTSRRWNVANNRRYLKAIEDKASYSETEELSAENQFNERILIGLRTILGVNLNELEAISVPPRAFYDKIESFIESNWMIQEGSVISLTKEGRLRADYIASELFC
ncbi:MAG: radical SAM family heme chaperone HemW [Crocinitomicaceae bacterium]|nr:radical SAM family heme chaperone HemW [Crocinitomicaceae bacterium]